MQINKILLALAISLTALVSCSKEVPINDSSEPIVTDQEHSLSVSIDAGADELRLAQVVGANGAIVSPFMEERDLVIRLTVRKKGGDPNQVKIQDVVFTKTPPDPRTGAKQLRATYTGKIKLPNGLTPTAGDVYEVCGILLREATDPGTEFLTPGATLWEPVSADQPLYLDPLTGMLLDESLMIADSESKVAANIPYLADWTDITVSNDGSRFEFTTMDFKPSGAIIRFRLHNPLPEEKTIQAIYIKTNMFFTNWMYNPKDPFARGNLLAGYRNDLEAQELRFFFPEGPIVLPPNNGVSDKDYYMRVMPSGSNTPKHLEIFLYDANGEQLLAFDSHNKLKAGSTLINLHMRTFTKTTGSFRPLLEGSTLLEAPRGSEVEVKKGFMDCLPIEYLAEYNVAPNGETFITSSQNNHSGIFTQREALKINIPGYYLPSTAEWNAIMPDHRARAELGIKTLNLPEPRGMVIPGWGTASSDLTADYIHHGGALYALRYRGGDNSLLTAYRYVFVGKFERGSLSSGLFIESKFVGPDFVKAGRTIDDITDKHFWEGPEVKSRYLPATSNEFWSGSEGRYWSADNPIDPRYSDQGIRFTPENLTMDSYTMGGYGRTTVRLFSYGCPPKSENRYQLLYIMEDSKETIVIVDPIGIRVGEE